MNTLELRLTAASPAEAARLVAALVPDNGDFLRSRAEGAIIVLEASAASPLGALRSIEDALQCLHAAGLRA